MSDNWIEEARHLLKEIQHYLEVIKGFPLSNSYPNDFPERIKRLLDE